MGFFSAAPAAMASKARQKVESNAVFTGSSHGTDTERGNPALLSARNAPGGRSADDFLVAPTVELRCSTFHVFTP